jgi:tRNA1(Val) A37 N6-methylase TrmN6
MNDHIDDPALTDDTLLGGRVRLTQARGGYRVAIDPVLLAAAVPAKAGQCILDVGSGTGAAALCLAARLPGLALTGLERDAAALALCRLNGAANGVTAEWIEGDVMTPPPALLARQFDHVISNPPYRSAGRGQSSPNADVAAAHAIDDDGFDAWLAFCAARVRDKGTLSLVLPAGAVARAVAVIEPRLGGISLLPLWPKAGVEAKRVILRARRGGRAPSRLLAGLVLHRDDGGYTDAAEQVLRHGGALAG